MNLQQHFTGQTRAFERGMRIIARLMISAAVPCMGALTPAARQNRLAKFLSLILEHGSVVK